jgi:hypothetical protein
MDPSLSPPPIFDLSKLVSLFATPILQRLHVANGYVDQGCRNVKLTRKGDHLWLSAECPKDNGEFRTSKIDLNLCIGYGGAKGCLAALDGPKRLTLMAAKGNYNEHRNFSIDDPRIFACEGEVNPRAAALLPWNWGADWGWERRTFELNKYLYTANGRLEFWGYKPVSAHNTRTSGFRS